jgi:hypothetical protein
MRNSEVLELTVIGIAMLFFSVLSIVAVWVFIRQWRREHPKDGERRD